jgi:hypothetical protein
VSPFDRFALRIAAPQSSAAEHGPQRGSRRRRTEFVKKTAAATTPAFLGVSLPPVPPE